MQCVIKVKKGSLIFHNVKQYFKINIQNSSLFIVILIKTIIEPTHISYIVQIWNWRDSANQCIEH